jgi:hypothetical protein
MSMQVYTYSEARQNLAALLERAAAEGGVIIKRRDGASFVVKKESPSRSPLDVGTVDARLTRDEIVDAVREGRARLREPRAKYTPRRRRKRT